MNVIIDNDLSTIMMVQGEGGGNRGNAYLGGYQNVAIPGLDYKVGSLDYVDMHAASSKL